MAGAHILWRDRLLQTTADVITIRRNDIRASHTYLTETSPVVEQRLEKLREKLRHSEREREKLKDKEIAYTQAISSLEVEITTVGEVLAEPRGYLSWAHPYLLANPDDPSWRDLDAVVRKLETEDAARVLLSKSQPIDEVLASLKRDVGQLLEANKSLRQSVSAQDVQIEKLRGERDTLAAREASLVDQLKDAKEHADLYISQAKARLQESESEALQVRQWLRKAEEAGIEQHTRAVTAERAAITARFNEQGLRDELDCLHEQLDESGKLLETYQIAAVGQEATELACNLAEMKVLDLEEALQKAVEEKELAQAQGRRDQERATTAEKDRDQAVASLEAEAAAHWTTRGDFANLVNAIGSEAAHKLPGGWATFLSLVASSDLVAASEPEEERPWIVCLGADEARDRMVFPLRAMVLHGSLDLHAAVSDVENLRSGASFRAIAALTVSLATASEARLLPLVKTLQMIPEADDPADGLLAMYLLACMILLRVIGARWPQFPNLQGARDHLEARARQLACPILDIFEALDQGRLMEVSEQLGLVYPDLHRAVFHVKATGHCILVDFASQAIMPLHVSGIAFHYGHGTTSTVQLTFADGTATSLPLRCVADQLFWNKARAACPSAEDNSPPQTDQATA